MTPRETIARAISVGHAHGESDMPWHPQGSDREDALPLWQWFQVDADAVLRALDAAGLVVVPRDPTEVMMNAGYRKVGKMHYEPTASAQGWGEHATDIYRAMIAAAPDVVE